MLTVMKKRVPRNAETGFSLVELMMTVSLMGVLMVGGLIAFLNVSLNAKDSLALSTLKSEYGTFTTLNSKETTQSAEIEAFGVENIGNVGAYKQVENFVEESNDSSKSMSEYTTFLRVSDLSGELDVVITYKGSTKMFDESEDGVVTASYSKMKIEQNR